MDTQEAYDKIRAYFTKPGAEFATDPKSQMCRYRTEDGRKCAVGAIIPDELYDPDMEGDTLAGVLRRVGEDDTELLRFCEAAQLAHDGQAFGGDMPAFIRELDELARRFGLKTAAS